MTKPVVTGWATIIACVVWPPIGIGAVLASTTLDFDRDVQPILARCVKCHGAGDPEAGLSLTERRRAVGSLESGNRAIVPGEPEQSELLRRVCSANPDERMPPTGPPLSAAEIETLRHWIRSGATWPEHWAYRLLQKPAPPAEPALRAWSRTPIDSFVAQKLAANHLRPSPPADRRTLLRRLYFDLTGLPPTPEELREFLDDARADAYERVVDRLLACPRYGERWARHWMDIVHYAETHGHDQDRPREHAWPYRDYLIRAFNADTPYDQFVQEQIAGDVLNPDDPWSLVATGFLATGPWDESSLRDIREDTIDREVARYLDRDDIVTTVMSTFASSTVHCARCHDHKFDPITQQEYYSLQAVFAATDKGNRRYDSAPEVGRQRQSLTQQLAAIPALQNKRDASLLSATLAAEVAAWESQIAEAAKRWVPLTPIEVASANGASLTVLGDGSVLSGGTKPDKDVTTIVVEANLPTLTGIRLEVLTDDSLPQKGPGRQDNGNLHLNELVVLPCSAAAARIELVRPAADFNQDGWSIDKAIDGNQATAWGVHPAVGKTHRAVFELKVPIRQATHCRLRVELHQTHGAGHLIGRARLSATDQPAPLSLEEDLLPSAVAAILRVPKEQRSESQRIELTGFYLSQRIERELAALPKQELVYCGSNQFDPDGSFRPAQKPRVVHVLHRGNITEPRQEAVPGALTCVGGLPHALHLENPNDDGRRRAALAGWLADPRNVLTWRSIANRVWQYHFGRGLVETANDFGKMGAAPTHPELLDWLAATLQEDGGSLKSLHRRIVTSATYRQASEHRADAARTDGDNHLLWRMNRRRLDAESIRDSLLAIAGTLDNKMGGPSAKQFLQSPGVQVTPNVDYINFDENAPANYRRGVYRFVFRTIPDPFLEALDCPDSSQLTPKRTESVTALQALATLNDKSFIHQGANIARRIESRAANLEAQIDAAFLAILLRSPDDGERMLLRSYISKHGLANACRFLANTNEFLFVD